MISTEKEVVSYSGAAMSDFRAASIFRVVALRRGLWLWKFGRGKAGDGASHCVWAWVRVRRVVKRMRVFFSIYIL